MIIQYTQGNQPRRVSDVGASAVSSWGFPPGGTAKLMVERFDENSVILTRQDNSGASIGLSARYEGRPNGSQIQNATVTGRWHWNSGRMQTKTWTWSASW